MSQSQARAAGPPAASRRAPLRADVNEVPEERQPLLPTPLGLRRSWFRRAPFRAKPQNPPTTFREHLRGPASVKTALTRGAPEKVLGGAPGVLEPHT